MLVSALSHVTDNDYLSARMQAAYTFLRTADLENLPLGRREIDGDNVFANVQEYESVPANQKQMEAHRRYYDVQYVVAGEELMQVAPLEDLVSIDPFDETTDFGLFETPEAPSVVVLHAGELAIVAPEDAHKPGCALGVPAKVRKVVVKVRAGI